MHSITWVPTKNYLDLNNTFDMDNVFKYSFGTYSVVDPIKEVTANNKQKYSAKYKLAGVKKENVKITYEDDLVTVKVEQKEVVSFNYIDTFDLSFIPKTFDAKMEDGLLTLEITPEKIEPLTIQIK